MQADTSIIGLLILFLAWDYVRNDLGPSEQLSSVTVTVIFELFISLNAFTRLFETYDSKIEEVSPWFIPRMPFKLSSRLAFLLLSLVIVKCFNRVVWSAREWVTPWYRLFWSIWEFFVFSGSFTCWYTEPNCWVFLTIYTWN